MITGAFGSAATIGRGIHISFNCLYCLLILNYITQAKNHGNIKGLDLVSGY